MKKQREVLRQVVYDRLGRWKEVQIPKIKLKSKQNWTQPIPPATINLLKRPITLTYLLTNRTHENRDYYPTYRYQSYDGFREIRRIHNFRIKNQSCYSILCLRRSAFTKANGGVQWILEDICIVVQPKAEKIILLYQNPEKNKER